MIALAPDVFLRAGLLQHPEMALTLLEAGTYHLIPPSTMYPDYVFSVHDVFTAMENYYPFGSVYLQNVKNALMNSGHAAPGWTYAVAEHHIYGSSRIGVHNTKKLIASRENQNPIVYTSTNTEYTTLYRGKRHYELSNHLGNVQVVISDKRVSVCDEYLGVDRFVAEVLSAMDYYPFGMLIPDRQWYANSDSSNYRFGFNGQEKDNEVAGVGNSMTAEFWQYDSRLGRRFNIDPVVKVWESPYACFANNPILIIDPNGDDSTSSQTPSQHTISKGETLWGLANKSNNQFTVDDLLKWNPGIEPKKLQVGQVINTSDPKATTPTETYSPMIVKKEEWNPPMVNPNDVSSTKNTITINKGESPFEISEMNWVTASPGLVSGSLGELQIKSKPEAPPILQGTLVTGTSFSLGGGFGVKVDGLSASTGRIIFDMDVSGSSLEEIFSTVNFVTIRSGGALLKAGYVVGYTDVRMSKQVFHAWMYGGGVVVIGYSSSRSAVKFENED